MVKTALDIGELVREYVGFTAGRPNIERIFLVEMVDVAIFQDGPPADEAWLIIISPDFEGLDVLERSSALVDVTLAIDFWTTSWGFTPDELEKTLNGRGGDGFLGMMLNQSREIYTAPQLIKMQEDGHD